MTRPSRGSRHQSGTVAAALSVLRPRFYRWARTTSQAGSRRQARLDLGAARPVPAVQEDLHSSSSMVTAIWSLQLRVPPTGVGCGRERQARATLPGFDALAR